MKRLKPTGRPTGSSKFPHKAVAPESLVGLATMKQKHLLRKLGLKVVKGLTKAQASEMIGKGLEGLREAARARGKASATQNTATGFSCTHDMPHEDDYYDGEGWDD